MPDVSHIAVWAALWGPGIIILIGFFLLLRNPPRFVGEFLGSQQALAIGMSKMAEAVQQISQKTDALEQVRMQKLDEVLVGQQLLIGKLESLERRMEHGSR